MYADAHCHLADPRFDGTRADVLVRAGCAGVNFFMQGGVNPADWAKQIELADERWGLCFGLHPWYVNDTDEAACLQALAQLEEILPKAVALGEVGLDKGPRLQPLRLDFQQEIMHRQLRLAVKHDKPIVLHIVRAHGPALEILRSEASSWRGIVHGFTGAKEVADQYIKLGLAVSVGGALLSDGFGKLKNALPHIPPQHLCVESDAPDGKQTDFRARTTSLRRC